MSHGPGGDNPHTRGIAAFVAGLTYERIPAEVIARIKLLILDSLGCALFGTELPWSRILMTTLGQLDTTTACAVWGTGPAPVGAACGARQRHPGAELRARRRPSRRRAPCRRRDAAGAARRRRVAARHERPRFPARRGRRLRDRAARRPVHGAGAYRPGLALRRHRRRVLGGRRRRGGAAAFARADRARARHRRHAGGRPDGGAIRRHGQAHACRARVAERALWRAAGRGGFHRHRRCVRERIWWLLHDFLALARPLPPRRADFGPRRALRDHGRRAQILFLRRQQPHQPRRHPHHRGTPPVPGRTTSPRSWCTARRRRSITSAGPTGRRASPRRR